MWQVLSATTATLMNKHLEKHFLKTYPKIFRDMYGDPKETAMAWGITCDDGWFAILDALCYQIQTYIDEDEHRKSGGWQPTAVRQVVARQVKEKLGGLRFYYEGGDDRIAGMVAVAMAMSHYTCELCGKANFEVGTTKGVIKHLCTGCAKKHKQRIFFYKPHVMLWKKVLKARTSKRKK
jgi:hypothetical protein